MATIYFGNRRLVVANYLSDERMAEADAILGYESGSNVKSFVNQFLNEEDEFTAFMYGNDYDTMMDEIESNFKLVTAAGGYVKNPNGEKLFIFRRGKWDLPKGKAEENESPRQTALREVEEETGITSLSITDELESSYHIYPEKGSMILKQTYWFEMKTDTLQNGTPQTEEDISEIKWLKASEIDDVLNNTYPSIIDVVTNAE